MRSDAVSSFLSFRRVLFCFGLCENSDWSGLKCLDRRIYEYELATSDERRSAVQYSVLPAR